MSPMLVSIMAQIFAVNAEVIGMQASNQQRATCNESPMYSEDHFKECSQTLLQLSTDARYA
jgi:hypothetical protein